MRNKTAEYIVTYPDSSDDHNTAIVPVHNNRGVLTRGGPSILDRAVDTVVDTAVTGGVNLMTKAAKKAANAAAKRIWKKKEYQPNVSGRGQRQPKAVMPIVTLRPPTNNPYVSNTAPVSVGNTLTGSQTKSRKIKNGHVVSGREFLGLAYDTKAVTTWTMALGAPLTPVSFVDSMLKQYGSMYNYFRWRKLKVWYITTSPTSTAGSVMLYYNKDRASTFLCQTSPNLMPFVLSDPHTTIGPQWQNFSTVLEPDNDWKRLDYGLTSDITHYSAGELFLLSKTGADTDTPGQLLMEYEIEFKDQNLTPRLLLWPQPTINYVPYNFQIPATATAGSSVFMGLAATTPIGSNANSVQIGGVYKVIIDYTNSGPWSAITPAVTNSTLIRQSAGSSSTVTISVMDGTTIYCVNGTSSVAFFPNATDAFANVNSLNWNVSITANTGNAATIFAWLSLVGYVTDKNMNPNM
nr:MAG: putative coat protein [Tombusviridae sp.]